MKNFKIPDPLLLLLALLATGIGLITILDAGYTRSITAERGNFPREFFSQAFYIVLAVGFGIIASNFSLKAWKYVATGLFLSSLVLCVAVKFGLGESINGAHRWLKLVKLQPAELAKFATILMLAHYFHKREPWVKPSRNASRRDVWILKGVRAWPFIAVLGMGYLIAIEPDLGTACILVVVALTMFLFGGVTWKSMLAMAVICAVGAGTFAYTKSYRMERLLNHSQRWEQDYIEDVGYQSVVAETHMASGGLLGVKPGNGRAKSFLPEATTDFIMVTVGEETGFLGTSVVMLLMAAMCVVMLIRSMQTASRFAHLVYIGSATWIAVQSITNLLMANAAIAPIGVPMPFISYGGSSLVCLWMAIALCCSMNLLPKVEKEVVNVPRRNRWWHRRSRISRP